MPNPRKPTQLKILEGNPGKRPLPKNEPLPPPGTPDCPDSLTETGKAEWIRITRQLKKLKMLHKIDRGLLVSWCDAWTEFVFACEETKKFGILMNAGRQMVANPALSIKHKAVERMLKIASQFGFSPSARTRIEIKQGESEIEEFDEWLEQGRKKA